VWSTRTLP